MPGRGLLATVERLRFDVGWSVVERLVTLLARTATFLMLSRALGPSGYGIFLGVYGILTPVGGLTYSGLRLGILQRVLLHGGKARSIARAYFSLAVAQGAIGLLIAVGIAMFALDDVTPWVLLAFGITELIFVAIIDVGSGVLHALETFASGAKLRAASETVRALTIASLFLTGWLTLASVSVAVMACSGMVAAYTFFILLPSRGIPPGLDRPVRADTTASAHLSTTLFSTAVKNDGDKTVLSAFGRNYEAGIYGAGYRVMQMALIPAQSVQAAVFDRYLRNGKADPRGQLGRALRYSGVVIPVSVIVAGGLFLISPWMHVLLGESFRESETVVRWLAPVAIIMSVGQGPADGLAALDRLGLRSVIALGAAGLALVLYVLLVPAYGWHGAAVGTFVSEATYAAALWAALVLTHRGINRGSAGNESNRIYVSAP